MGTKLVPDLDMCDIWRALAIKSLVNRDVTAIEKLCNS